MRKPQWMHAALSAAGEATGVCLLALLLDESWLERLPRLLGNWVFCFLLMFVIVLFASRVKAEKGDHDHET